MPILKEDVIIAKEEEGTEGGTTYHIIMKNDPDKKVRKLCFRFSKSPSHPGERCSKPAGYNTSHPGTGACSLHGGNNHQFPSNITIKNGKQAYATRFRLTQKISNYLDQDAEEEYSLSKELAATRAIMEEFIEHMSPPLDENGEYNRAYGNDVIRFSMLVGTLGNLVEKISKINSRNTLTAAQALYIKALVADILVKYIKDPDVRERAVVELTTRFGDGSATPYTLVNVNKYEEVKDD